MTTVGLHHNENLQWFDDLNWVVTRHVLPLLLAVILLSFLLIRQHNSFHWPAWFAPLPVKQPWKIQVYTSDESTKIADKTTTKQSKAWQNHAHISRPSFSTDWLQTEFQIYLIIVIYFRLVDSCHCYGPISLTLSPSQFKFKWKFYFALVQILRYWLLQFFAHAKTAELPWHVQKTAAIPLPGMESHWNEIFLKFGLRWKNR